MSIPTDYCVPIFTVEVITVNKNPIKVEAMNELYISL